MTHQLKLRLARNLRDGIPDTLARGREKTEQVLLWLTEFHYSTIPLLSRRLTGKALGQSAFINRLVERRIVRHTNVPTYRSRLYLLTPHGRELARTLTSKAIRYSTEPSKVNPSTVVHNLSVQLAVLRRAANNDSIESERHLSITGLRKLPDALLHQSLALEVELTHKSDARIYRGFFDYYRALRDGLFQNVEYVFPNATLCAYYRKRFCADTWPIFEYDRRTFRLRDTHKALNVDSSRRAQFRLVHEDLV
jgi:hypothetical protein